MSVQLLRKNWYVALVALVLALALVACSPFGKTKGSTTAPTATPPPTETPLPVLPTYTPTQAAVAEAPTNTPASPAEAEARPTLTPTPPAPAPAQAVGGAQPPPAATPVTYKVTTVPTMGNVIKNGSFEDGFDEQGVALDWTPFSNGDAVFVWADELQPTYVSHDLHAQRMQIMGPGQPDRFIGIYQTVDVVAGETYTLALHGLIRSSTAKDDSGPFGHRMQWAIFEGVQTNWYEANQDWASWTDPGWNDVKLDAKNPAINAFVQQITPETDQITLYIRGWTKWPILGSEAMFYVDGVSLEGPIPGEETTIQVAPVQGSVAAQSMPTTGGTGTWIPVAGAILVVGFAAWEIRKNWTRTR